MHPLRHLGGQQVIDPIDCLKEIAALAMDRMNSGDKIAPGEAFTLGQISGTACRVPEVMTYLREREESS